uniref:hypothetical protein n=1 Tax=Brucella pseudintermedia TaxID=370111 RepID=UPI001589D335|nr:hypothetical protein [Brucella pseudintermedia]
MPSKELTHEELKAIIAAKMADPNTTAADILSTILAALQEPSASMVLAASEQVRIKSIWRAMLAASALGEQSYRSEIISADGAIWDETAPGSRNFKRREQSE